MTDDEEEAPRAMTTQEMREALLEHIRSMVHYWATTDLNRPEFKAELTRRGEIRYRMEGLVHSILAMFDGCSVGIPALDITPSPHPDDEAFHRDNGDNWWVKTVINECMLHDLWHGDRR